MKKYPLFRWWRQLAGSSRARWLRHRTRAVGFVAVLVVGTILIMTGKEEALLIAVVPIAMAMAMGLAPPTAA